MIPVRLETGVVVMHTREEYELLWRGVDPEVCEAMTAEIADGEAEDE